MRHVNHQASQQWWLKERVRAFRELGATLEEPLWQLEEPLKEPFCGSSSFSISDPGPRETENSLNPTPEMRVE